MEAMKKMGDNQFDLAIVDPPYGIGDFQQSDANYTGVTWNNKRPESKYFSELLRASKHQIIWGANYYNCFSKLGGAIVWDKLNPHPSMSDCEIASTSTEKRTRRFTYEWHGYVVKRVNPDSFHPCQKPVALYKWLLQNYAKEGDKIFDTHGGSMSIAIACWDLKFDLELYEIDKDYYEAGMSRFNNHCKQGQLF